jgi:hypothetical protein
MKFNVIRLAQLNERGMNMNWINIDKQQPEEEQEYLCFCEDGCYWLGMWIPDDNEFAMLGTKHAQGSVDVIYWQELPDAPSTEIIEG